MHETRAEPKPTLRMIRVTIYRDFYSEKDLDQKGIATRVTRWRMRKNGDFPEPVKISPGRVGYPAAQVEKWVAERDRSEKVAQEDG